MAEINYTPQFTRDFKKLKKKHYDLDKLKHVISLLVEEQFEILKNRYDDHQLKGSLKKLRALHVEHNKAGNWILVYRINKGKLELLTIDLISTGSHNHSYRGLVSSFSCFP